MALSIIAEKTQAGYSHVVDVDLKSYFDTISHELLLELVGRRVGDVRVIRLIRAWLKAGVLEEGRVTHPDRGSPQGGVVSPLLSNVMLHEVDRQWCRGDGTMSHSVVLVRYAIRYGAAGAYGIRGKSKRGSISKTSLRLFNWW